MVDVVDAMIWWDKWQLRVLVLGSLILQWFLLLAAPMRKYAIHRCFRTFIWLAYISSDALAIYALATLFNRHARATGGCGFSASAKASALEVLWAPILLIHLGGQRELTAYEIEDNELWTRHTVTLVSQVTVAVYAFYKARPSSSDRRLLVLAILLFITGFLSFCEKPWAVYRARINRLAAVSAMLEEQDKTRWYCFCFTELDKYSMAMVPGEVKLRSERVNLHMVLSDLSLYAAASDLKHPRQPLPGGNVSKWLRSTFGVIYTRANVVTTPAYIAYHLLLLPSLHTAAIALFATIPKHGYEGTDVRMTYILVCLTAGLDLLAPFIRVLLHLIMFHAEYPALCETIPEYNLVGSALLRIRRPGTSWWLKCATKIGCSEEYFDCGCWRRDMYSTVIGFLAIDLVKVVGGEDKVEGLDLSTYRSFSQGSTNWALGDDLRRVCGRKIKRTLRASFDRSVLIWHIATDLCFRRLLPDKMWLWSRRMSKQQLDDTLSEEEKLRQLCTQAISNYMAHLLNSRADMLMTGSRQHLLDRARQHMECILKSDKDIKHKHQGKQQQLDGQDIKRIMDEVSRLAKAKEPNRKHNTPLQDACLLAEELIGIADDDTRWRLMYRVWVGMLCYSASMCRGYLHAKSLGEGGEFLSVVWLILSLKGARTLADKLQMPEPEDGDDDDV